MMYGRLTLVEGDLGMLDAMPEPMERPLAPGEIPGLRAVYCLIDRETGRSAALSLWESREAMDAGEAHFLVRRDRATGTIGGRLVSEVRMEVVNALWDARP